MIPIDDDKKEEENESSDSLCISTTVDEIREMQISGDAKEVKLKEDAEEKDTSVKGVELDEEAKLEKDVTKLCLLLISLTKQERSNYLMKQKR